MCRVAAPRRGHVVVWGPPRSGPPEAAPKPRRGHDVEANIYIFRGMSIAGPEVAVTSGLSESMNEQTGRGNGAGHPPGSMMASAALLGDNGVFGVTAWHDQGGAGHTEPGCLVAVAEVGAHVSKSDGAAVLKAVKAAVNGMGLGLPNEIIGARRRGGNC